MNGRNVGKQNYDWDEDGKQIEEMMRMMITTVLKNSKNVREEWRERKKRRREHN